MTGPVPGLRRLWRQPWPARRLAGPLRFSPLGAHVALGSSWVLDEAGDTLGSLTVYEAADGHVVQQNADAWVAGPIAFDPDGRRLMTSEIRFQESGRLTFHRQRIIDLETLTERVHTVDFEGQMPVLSPDGRLLMSHQAFPVFMVDVQSGAELWRKSEMVGRFGWRADGDFLAVGTDGGGTTTLAVLTAADGTRRPLTTTPGSVEALAYTPDGGTIVAFLQEAYDDADPGNLICAFDAESGARLWESRQHDVMDVMDIDVSDDGRWAAVYGLGQEWGATIGVYDMTDGRPRFPAQWFEMGRSADAGTVRFSPTLRHIVVQGGEGSKGVVVLDARTGREYGRTPPGDSGCAIAPDGGSIVAAMAAEPPGSGGAVECYDLGLAISRHDVDAPLYAMVMSSTGTPLVAVAGAGTGTGSAVTVIDAASGTRLTRKPVPGTVASCVFADHDQAVAVGGSDGLRLYSILGERSWTADTIGRVNALAVAGEWIATAADRTVRLLHVSDGHPRWPSPGTHPQTVTRIAFGPDGRWVATGCADRYTRVLDAGTGTEVFQVRGDGQIRDLAFAADGTLLATANEDGKIILIEPVGKPERGRITRPFGCSRIVFSPGGTLLAAAWDDNTVSIFDLAAAADIPPKLREFTFATPVTALAFSPAEHAVVIATEGAPMTVYVVRDGIELARFPLQAPVDHLAFSADGTLLATARADGTVGVWAGASPPPS